MAEEEQPKQKKKICQYFWKSFDLTGISTSEALNKHPYVQDPNKNAASNKFD